LLQTCVERLSYVTFVYSIDEFLAHIKNCN